MRITSRAVSVVVATMLGGGAASSRFGGFVGAFSAGGGRGVVRRHVASSSAASLAAFRSPSSSSSSSSSPSSFSFGCVARTRHSASRAFRCRGPASSSSSSIGGWAATPPSSSLFASVSTEASSSSSSSSSAEEDSTPSSSSDLPPSSSSLLGIDWVRSAVVSVLNDAFDPAEVARGAAMTKLDKGKKKKKKNKKNNKKGGDNDPAAAATPAEETPEVPPPMSEEERRAIGDAAAASANPFGTMDTMVTPATRSDFGDYQCNAAMGLAKNVGMNPRECASRIVDGLRPIVGYAMEEPEIAGPGFINLRFKESYLAEAARRMAEDADGRLAVPMSGQKKKVIIDFSSPNIAKEMHVGHLRSTIIGDTLSNVLEFAGHDVVRLNHVGDWGTQFGMLVEHLRDEYPAALNEETSTDVDLGDLVQLYKAAKKRFDADEEFKVRAREGVVRLQGGDGEAIAAWKSLCAASRVEYQKIYDALNIEGLEERGESFYNPFLNGVVEDLEGQGLAVESEGATAVFLDGYANRDGTPLPMLVRKSDGGFNYATTDLAAIRHRVQLPDGENADRVLYVTDAGQSQHFEMVFAAAELAGFLLPSSSSSSSSSSGGGDDGEDNKAGPSLEHVPFGLVQGEDGKKFATRSGDTVRLRDLLDEAVRIAGEDTRSRSSSSSSDDDDDPDAELSDEAKRVSEIVGIGAVKYADLSMNRESNYRFSYERMLSLNGNTAPYMLYAYARLCGIVRKAAGVEFEEGETMEWPEPSDVIISHESERELVRSLVKLPDVLSEVESELYPNKLCDYLFETSQKFNQFYENCSVKNAETPELKASRLSLCTVTAGTIRLLMGLLGIQVVERL